MNDGYSFATRCESEELIAGSTGKGGTSKMGTGRKNRRELKSSLTTGMAEDLNMATRNALRNMVE